MKPGEGVCLCTTERQPSPLTTTAIPRVTRPALAISLVFWGIYVGVEGEEVVIRVESLREIREDEEKVGKSETEGTNSYLNGDQWLARWKGRGGRQVGGRPHRETKDCAAPPKVCFDGILSDAKWNFVPVFANASQQNFVTPFILYGRGSKSRRAKMRVVASGDIRRNIRRVLNRLDNTPEAESIARYMEIAADLFHLAGMFS
ncbi:hypothetical protein ALC56_11446 [Trachymyrmex septentrionalis]|uniref:Uncharacterized protein n=1 Tax=Trachymyrmex septentrionalis TaxID=34720 RepID=A0A195F2L9_9HYME|nr:hypothetical protein ALC56_11446 [Trachymyrmex septentrionalis]